MTDRIEAGQLVFVADGEIGVAGVREVRPHESTFVINVQNGGDFVLPLSAVTDVHSGKVIWPWTSCPKRCAPRCATRTRRRSAISATPLPTRPKAR